MRPRSLFARLMTTHLVVAVAAIGILGIAVDRVFEHRALDDLKERLIAEARETRTAIAGTTGAPLQAQIRALGSSSGARLTVIRIDGVVLADSEHDPATMENHATPSRPEVLAAIRGSVGSAQRLSETLKKPFLYVAIPLRDGLVVRAALPATRISSQRNAIRLIVVFSFLGMALIALGLSALMARSVSRPLTRIADDAALVARGELGGVKVMGPPESRRLAKAVNEMAAELAQQFDEIRSESDLRDQILGAMDEGVLLVDGGMVVYANGAASELLGARQGHPAPPQLRQPSGREPSALELTIHHPVRRVIRVTVAPLADARILIVAQDVTDAHRIDEIRRDFVANASHEMKTPVAGILAAAETIHDAIREDPREAQRFAGNLAKEARRLSNLIQDLLDLARLDQAPAERGVAPLSELVRRVVDEARDGADDKRLTVSSDIGEQIEVPGRPGDLELLTRNLLDNAIQYTPEGGSVSIHLSREDGKALLSIQDSGIGIPAKDLPRIFERFFRVDRARARETGGTGLGLSIVRHIAESHGGSVTAESELGKGSTFTVSLPSARPD